ncbi:response regulator transcription factor [Dyadobacter sp.]|uniref:response regulator transcription factor n=1 Tax=Dyadobacter sp. TaxID=1914288 RepID=UPI003F70F306
MFTKQEIQILHFIASGYPSAQIAEKLFISRETLKTHRKNIIRKIRQSHDSRITLLQFAITYAKEVEKSP